MKYLLSIITLLLFAWQTTFAQTTVDDLQKDSAKLYVEYAAYRGYVNDSIYRSFRRTSLFLGKKAAVYIYQRRSPEEFLKELRESTKSVNKSVSNEEVKDLIVNEFKKRHDIEKKVSSVYARYYHSRDYLELRATNDGDIWLSDTATYYWKPVNEFKTISGYKCQKATLRNLNWEDVTAWFAEDIPLPAGPWRVSGLPGLILEFHNPHLKRYFRAILISSTHIPEQRFRKWLSGPIVSKSENAEIYYKGFKKFEQMKEMIESEKKKKQ